MDTIVNTTKQKSNHFRFEDTDFLHLLDVQMLGKSQYLTTFRIFEQRDDSSFSSTFVSKLHVFFNTISESENHLIQISSDS